MKSAPTSIAYLIAPPIALVIASPLVISFSMGKLWYLAVPFWAGLVSSPGYVWGWWLVRGAGTASDRILRWVRSSLVLAAAASAAGAIEMLMFGPFALVPALCAYCSVCLLAAVQNMEASGTRVRQTRMVALGAIVLGAAAGLGLLAPLVL